MELRITKHNMYTFPVYIDLFKRFPKVREVHLWSEWVHGYFGSSCESYAEINGKRVSRRKFDDFIYRGVEWKEIIEFLSNLE